jgi:hypothetical protein
LFLHWDGYDAPVLGSVHYGEGTFVTDIQLPGGATRCAGRERARRGIVEWAVSCQNGLTASGRSIALGEGNGSVGADSRSA